LESSCTGFNADPPNGLLFSHIAILIVGYFKALKGKRGTMLGHTLAGHYQEWFGIRGGREVSIVVGRLNLREQSRNFREAITECNRVPSSVT